MANICVIPIATITSVVPKSGWSITKKAATTRGIKNEIIPLPFETNLAKYNAIANFKISAGCTEKYPKFSHLLAPKALLPNPGITTKISKIIPPMKMGNATFSQNR